jgi:hypothetical protein
VAEENPGRQEEHVVGEGRMKPGVAAAKIGASRSWIIVDERVRKAGKGWSQSGFWREV